MIHGKFLSCTGIVRMMCRDVNDFIYCVYDIDVDHFIYLFMELDYYYFQYIWYNIPSSYCI
jgi:hypothetical protein